MKFDVSLSSAKLILQFKKRPCNGIFLHGFDVCLWFHNRQIFTYFCIYKLFQFFCSKVILLCKLQFCFSHLNTKGIVYCLDCKNKIFLLCNYFSYKFWCSIKLFNFQKVILIVPFHFVFKYGWTTFYDSRNDLYMLGISL